MTISFNHARDLLEIAKKQKTTVAKIMIERDQKLKNLSEAEVLKQMEKTIQVMEEAMEEGLTMTQKSISGLTGGEAKKMMDYKSRGNTIMDGLSIKVAAAAMATLHVNASMGRIVAAPTAGASGVVPAALIMVAKEKNIAREKLIEAMFSATAVGLLAVKNWTISGAGGGCQAEIGIASSMAAMGLTTLMGGDDEAAFTAAALALHHLEGLVCDPVAGLVECPCTTRNAMGAMNAMLSADMALSGMGSLIDFDQSLMAAAEVGNLMSPLLKETAKGGLARTPTAKALRKAIFQEEIKKA